MIRRWIQTLPHSHRLETVDGRLLAVVELSLAFGSYVARISSGPSKGVSSYGHPTIGDAKTFAESKLPSEEEAMTAPAPDVHPDVATLAEQMNRTGTTKIEVVEALDVRRGTLNSWLRGLTRPHGPAVPAIRDLAGRLARLPTYEPPPPPPPEPIIRRSVGRPPGSKDRAPRAPRARRRTLTPEP